MEENLHKANETIDRLTAALTTAQERAEKAEQVLLKLAPLCQSVCDEELRYFGTVGQMYSKEVGQALMGINVIIRSLPPNSREQGGGEVKKEPCPFCGSEEQETKVDDGIFWTRCMKCEATGPTNTKYSGEEDEDYIGWHSRPQIQAAKEWKVKALRRIEELERNLTAHHEALQSAQEELEIARQGLQGARLTCSQQQDRAIFAEASLKSAQEEIERLREEVSSLHGTLNSTAETTARIEAAAIKKGRREGMERAAEMCDKTAEAIDPHPFSNGNYIQRAALFNMAKAIRSEACKPVITGPYSLTCSACRGITELESGADPICNRCGTAIFEAAKAGGEVCEWEAHSDENRVHFHATGCGYAAYHDKTVNGCPFCGLPIKIKE